MIIGESYREQLNLAFKFSSNRSFCQIASIAKKNNEYIPKLRTVLLYLEDEHDCFSFSTSTQTSKWQQLQRFPKVTGLLFDQANFEQYRFEADVILIDSSNSAAYERFYQDSWRKLRVDLRHVLWQEYLEDKHADYNVEEIFPHHGMVLLEPYYWDIFKLGVDDFANSQRVQMILKQEQWQVYEKTPIICPLELKD